MSEQTTAPTERDELADDIRSLGITVVSGPPVDLSAPLAQHLRGLGYRKPRTVTTVEELDALPVGSVVLDRLDVCYRLYNDARDEFPVWCVVGETAPSSPRRWLPAAVLHEGGGA